MMDDSSEADYLRRCPSCGHESAPEVMRCLCGALLAGVDMVRRETAQRDDAPATPDTPQAQPAIQCSHEDCRQFSPAGSAQCLYCNRPLSESVALTPAGQVSSLLNLPATLGQRYRILQPLPACGAEAELLLVQAHAGGPTRVAKIYRHGIQPKAAIQQRLATIPVRHRVELLEEGVADGHAYELMEFCTHGSWRDRLRAGAQPEPVQLAFVSEIAAALEAVHAAGLLHRDLKPENILVRSETPLVLVLTDFGIASVLDATQRFTGTARTLPYASPESLSGVIDGKADYWALGVMLLETALGRHPYAGLSEAVILHHLTTRSIDLGGITGRNLRKLLRGLLQRDPALRWGAGEIKRWLANDPGLPEPAAHSGARGFAEPYHVAQEVCHSVGQLAVALVQNWRHGVADLANGQLLAWFRDVQKDQNLVRLLLELRHERQITPDLQLLRLILHLAPGIVPVWRGESIELTAILSYANRALKGDTAAQDWLDLLYRNHVLEIYAKAGNQQAASLAQRWNGACDRFALAWEAGLALLSGHSVERGPDEYVDFDEAVYGNGRLQRPSLAFMHPQLLAIAYDDQWSERLRLRLTLQLAPLLVYCPWLNQLGDPLIMDAAALLVLQALLPEAAKVAARQQKADQRRREEQVGECQAMAAEYATLLMEMRAAGRHRLITPAVCEEWRGLLQHYFALAARVRSGGRADAPWQELTKSLSRVKTTASQMLLLIDQVTERHAVDAGWFDPRVLGFLVLAIMLLPAFFGPGWAYLVMAAATGVTAWRLLPHLSIMCRVAELARRF